MIFRKADPKDFDILVELTDSVGWNYAESDFLRMIMCDPNCLMVAEEEGRIVGLISGINYGEVGWIGNLFVHEAHRRGGTGRRLLEKILQRFSSLGLKTIGLYSLPETVQFYEKAGFVLDKRYVMFSGIAREVGSSPAVGFTDNELGELENLDTEAFGFRRGGLIMRLSIEFGEGFHILRGRGGVEGFVIARKEDREHRIGPLLAKSSHIAEELLKAALSTLSGTLVRVLVPESKKISLELLKKHGFEEEGLFPRMYRGEKLKEGSDVEFATYGLEWG